MAEESLLGLFSGADPYEARRAARVRVAQPLFGLSRNMIEAAAVQGGSALGEAVGRAFGRQFPEEDRANKIRQVQQAIMQRGLAPNRDPEFYTTATELFSQAGLPDLAQRAQVMGAQAIPKLQARARQTKARGAFLRAIDNDPNLPDVAKQALKAQVELDPKEAFKSFAAARNPDIDIETIGVGDNQKQVVAVDKQGRVVRKLGEPFAGSSTGQTRSARIAELTDRLVQTQEMDPTTARRRAIDIVDGNIELEVVPETGRVRETDVVTGSAREVPLSGGPARVGVPEGSGLYDLAGQGVTGVIPGVIEFTSGPLGQIPGVDFGEETTTMRQVLRASSRNLIRSLSINQRFPMAEQERIRKEVNTLPSLLGSEEQLKARMVGLDRQLRRDIAQARRDAADPSLPEEVRESQGSNAVAMRNFLDQMRAPAPLPRNPEDIQALPRNELLRRYNNAPDFELRALPVETLKVLRARLQEDS